MPRSCDSRRHCRLLTSPRRLRPGVRLGPGQRVADERAPGLGVLRRQIRLRLAADPQQRHLDGGGGTKSWRLNGSATARVEPRPDRQRDGGRPDAPYFRAASRCSTSAAASGPFPSVSSRRSRSAVDVERRVGDDLERRVETHVAQVRLDHGDRRGRGTARAACAPGSGRARRRRRGCRPSSRAAVTAPVAGA